MRASGRKPIERRRNVGIIAMDLKTNWEMLDEISGHDDFSKGDNPCIAAVDVADIRGMYDRRRFLHASSKRRVHNTGHGSREQGL